MKIKRKYFAVTQVRLFAFALTGAVLSSCGDGAASRSMPAMPPPEVAVVTLKAQPVLLERDLPGRISARLVAEVRPQVGGLVRRMLFTEGGMVRAGQLLYQLDDAAALAALATAQASVQRAEAVADGARRNATRGSELIKARMISVQDNDNLQTALKQAEAELAAAQATLQSSRVNLDYTRVTAPIAGRIGKSAVTEGALLVANQAAPLAIIQRLDEVYVDVTQSSREWLQLRRELGDGDNSARGVSRVRIALEDGQRYEPDGKLQFTDVTVDDSTGSFLLRVLVPNPKGLLLPGMLVTATIGERQLQAGLLAPQQGVTRDPRGRASAMVVGSDGKVQERQLTVLRTIGDQWLVGSGLVAGDRIIVEGLQKVQPGSVVRAKEAQIAPAVAAPAAVPEAAQKGKG